MAKGDVAHLKDKMVEGQFDELASASQAVSMLLKGDNKVVEDLGNAMWLEVGRGRGRNFEEEKINRETAKVEAKTAVTSHGQSTHQVVGPHTKQAVSHDGSSAIREH